MFLPLEDAVYAWLVAQSRGAGQGSADGFRKREVEVCALKL